MKMNRSIALATLAGFSILMIGTGAGCHNDDGMNQQQLEKADRLSKIAASSGGDWEKVTADDRKYILETFASNNENTAKMLLMAKSGKLKGAPGGNPRK